MSMRTNMKNEAGLSREDPLLVVSTIAMIHVQIVVVQIDFYKFVIMHRSDDGLPPPCLIVLSIAANYLDPPRCEDVNIILQALCVVVRRDGLLICDPFLGVPALARRCTNALRAEPMCLIF